MRAIDTNVLVRLITRDDPAQTKSAETFIAKGAWVPQIVVVETSWVLASVYDFPPDKVALAIRMLLEHEHLAVQDAHVVDHALRDFEETPKLGFSDCLIVSVAKKAGHVPVGTFDRALSRLTAAEGL